MSDRDLSNTEPVQSAPSSIYHYTNQDGLLGIIGSKSLWATHFHHLNDESEWKVGCDLYSTCVKDLLEEESDMRRLHPHLSAVLPGPEFRDALTEFLKGIVETVAEQHAFITSFIVARAHLLREEETVEDDLNQWGGSGGFAIGFDKAELASKLKSSAQADKMAIIVAPCIYDLSVLKMTFFEIVRGLIANAEKFASKNAAGDLSEFGLSGEHNEPNLKAVRELVLAIASAKHRAFRSENEWRLTVLPMVENRGPKFRRGKSSIVPYVEVRLADGDDTISSIKEIVVGPSSRREDAAEALKMFLRYSNYKLQEDGAENGVVIKSSVVPYRDW